MRHLPNNSENRENQDAAKELIETVKKIKYGSIVVTVHDGKIVQIDKTEKIRFPNLFAGGGGI